MVNIVAIPTIDPNEYLPVMIPQLLADPDVDWLLIMDNGHAPDAFDAWRDNPKFHLVDARGMGLYKMWNFAWGWAIASDPDAYLCLLNDDLVMPDGLVGHLADALDCSSDVWLVSPDYLRPLSEGVNITRIDLVTGSYRHGGACGWAFMFKAGKVREGLPLCDEKYEWWYGDDDLFFNVTTAGGKLGIVRGLPLEHPHEVTARNHEWTFAARERDTVRWREQRGDV